MLSIGGVTALTGTLVLKCAERPEEAQAEAPEGREGARPKQKAPLKLGICFVDFLG